MTDKAFLVRMDSEEWCEFAMMCEKITKCFLINKKCIGDLQSRHNRCPLVEVKSIPSVQIDLTFLGAKEIWVEE